MIDNKQRREFGLVWFFFGGGKYGHLGDLVISGTGEPMILSRASGVGSQTNHPGSGQRQDTGPGIL